MLDNCFGRPGSMANPAGGPPLAWTTRGIAFPDVDLVHGHFAPDPGWFRGYQYARYLRRITGISLLEPVIGPTKVALMAESLAAELATYPSAADANQIITLPDDRFMRIEMRLPDTISQPNALVMARLAVLGHHEAHALLVMPTLPDAVGRHREIAVAGVTVTISLVPCDLVLMDLRELVTLFHFAAQSGLSLYAWE